MAKTYNIRADGNRNINNLKRMAYFAEVVEAGSFTAAAKRLAITKAVVSQQVASLEQAFETTLLIRSTRSVRLTEEGRIFYDRCMRVLAEAQVAFDTLEAEDRAPSGTLRLTAPFDYGIAVIVPAIADYQRRFPACAADLVISDQTLDQVERDIELAIRVGWLEDSSLRTRRIGSFRQLFVANPQVAAGLSTLGDPTQFAHLPFIANGNLRDPLHWTFHDDAGQKRSVRFTSTCSISATLGVLEAVREGMGVSIVPDFAVAADLAGGRVVALLPDWKLDSGGIHAVMPGTRFRPSRVSAFLDLLMERESGRR